MITYRYLGASGLKVTEIIYGNWLTHGSQIEDDQASACVKAALDAGITSFDTADVYAGGRAESVLGRILKGERRDGLEVFTKIFWPIGDGPNDRGLSRKHLIEGIHGSLARLQMDYVDVLLAHRYDYETPLEETMLAFADIIRRGQALYIGVSEWPGSKILAAAQMAKDLGVPLIASQPQYSMLHRVIEAEVIPASIESGIGQIVFSPIAQGVLTGKYLPGQALPAGSRATDEKGGANMVRRWVENEEVLTRVQLLKPIAEQLELTLAQLAVAWVLQNPNVSAAIIGASRPEQVVENVKASGVTIPPELMTAIDDALGDVVLTDPGLTFTGNPSGRP